MLKFVLREVTDVKNDTILAIAFEPADLLGRWDQNWKGINFFKVCAEIDGNSADVAIVELAGDRRYAIYGTNPRPNNSDAELQSVLYVAGVDQAITTVCNYLQKFYKEGRLVSYADLVALRAIPCR